MTEPERLPDAVAVGYVHNDDVISYNFHVSYVSMRTYDSAHDVRVGRGGTIAVPYQTGGIVRARRNVVRAFLTATEAPWLLMIDTDMGFPADVADRLVEAADPVERPVVGALCFAQALGRPDGMGGYRPAMWPVLLRWVDGAEPGFYPILNYPQNKLMRVDATGAACLLVHRSVFERLCADNGGGEWAGWFDPVPSPKAGEDDLSEDFSFCYRLRQAGIPLHVNTAVKTTHLKPNWLCEDGYLTARGQQEQPPPASTSTEEVAVIVPVMRRPGNARPFMESLAATDPHKLCTVYAVADEGDDATIGAWRAAGAKVLVDRCVTFPRKVNLGYRQTREPWLFMTGDDVRFHPGWLGQAMTVAQQTGANVVGTNDLGNERVQRGEHAVHMFIRRSYVDEVGASWDGPGVVCHEGYRHWFVDDEIVTAAKQRGTFASAKWSVVEHLHPYWGKAEPDDVHRLGEDQAMQDQQRFVERYTANAWRAEAVAA